MRGKSFFNRRVFLLVGTLFATLLGGYGLYEFKKQKELTFLDHPEGEGPGIEAWSKFAPEKEHFSVFFPDEPEHSTKELSIPGSKNTLLYQEYRCRESSKVISISYTVLPDDWLKWGAKKVLRKTIKFLIAKLKNTRLSGQSANVFKSYPSLDFQHLVGGRETAGTLILCKNILYKLEISYPVHEHEQMRRQLAQFIASFEPSEIS